MRPNIVQAVSKTLIANIQASKSTWYAREKSALTFHKQQSFICATGACWRWIHVFLDGRKLKRRNRLQTVSGTICQAQQTKRK
jgi:hypothetical protein